MACNKAVMNGTLSLLDDLCISWKKTSMADGLHEEMSISSRCFCDVVYLLSSELAITTDMKYHFSINDFDHDTFVMEISGFLDEYGCVALDYNTAFVDSSDRCLDLLDFLASELAACRMLKSSSKNNNQYLSSTTADLNCSQDVVTSLESLVKSLHVAPSTLFPNPLGSIAVALNERIREEKLLDYVGAPLFTTSLSSDQWCRLDDINVALCKEYTLRRAMLLKRLDVTIGSFMCSKHIKDRQSEVMAVYSVIRHRMSSIANIDSVDVLFATNVLISSTLTKTTSRKLSTDDETTQLVPKDVVPDRNGRTKETDGEDKRRLSANSYEVGERKRSSKKTKRRFRNSSSSN